MVMTMGTPNYILKAREKRIMKEVSENASFWGRSDR